MERKERRREGEKKGEMMKDKRTKGLPPLRREFEGSHDFSRNFQDANSWVQINIHLF